MRIGRVVLVTTELGKAIGQVTAIQADGLKYKTSATADEQFAPLGTVHKLKGFTLKSLITEFNGSVDANGFHLPIGGTTFDAPFEAQAYDNRIYFHDAVAKAIGVELGEESVESPLNTTEESLGSDSDEGDGEEEEEEGEAAY